jgi:hypothetical protein
MYLSTVGFLYFIYVVIVSNPLNVPNFDRFKNFQQFPVKNVSIPANQWLNF